MDWKKKTLRFTSPLGIAMIVGTGILMGTSSAQAQYNNPPGPVGGRGTNWENPPGPVGGSGASPNEAYRYNDRAPIQRGDNNPPGPVGGRGTNWENPPGPVGGPGASPDSNYQRYNRYDRNDDTIRIDLNRLF